MDTLNIVLLHDLLMQQKKHFAMICEHFQHLAADATMDDAFKALFEAKTLEEFIQCYNDASLDIQRRVMRFIGQDAYFWLDVNAVVTAVNVRRHIRDHGYVAPKHDEKIMWPVQQSYLREGLNNVDLMGKIKSDVHALLNDGLYAIY